jgi:hypothetical protein
MGEAATGEATPLDGKTAETIEEIHFYLEHGMPEQATAAFEKLQAITRDEATVSALRAEIDAASQHASAVEEVSTVETVAEFATDEPSVEFDIAEIPEPVAQESPAVDEPAAPQAQIALAETAASRAEHTEPAPPQLSFIEPPVPRVPGVLQDFVSDLESSLGDSFLPGTISHEAEPVVEQASAPASDSEFELRSDEALRGHVPELEPIGNAAPTAFGVAETEPMGEFVADLEASLGEDFLRDAPVAETEPAPQPQPAPQIETAVASAPVHHRPEPTTSPAPPAISPVAAAAAAAASGVSTASPQTPAPIPQRPVPPAPKPQISPGIPTAVVPGATAPPKSSPFGEDAGVDLAEMFGELKHDLEAGSSTTEEDPETHYNLGIAFREMGLLDEAIGELQKTCQAVDHGHPFQQVMQTYTWLAQCFLDKGLPEAAIRWYQKALNAPGIDEETRTALHYELAAAYESAGDKPSALKHFMEVYGRNIDYRDVAERIKPLKS